MILGIRAHDLGMGSASELAALAAERGLQAVQLAPAKAIPGAPPVGGWNPGFAWQTAQAFAKQGVQIAVLGCYINPVHPDPAARRAEIKRFKEALRFARDFGASVVGTETGSLYADCSPHPGNRDEAALVDLLSTLRELTEEAEKWGVMIALEAAAEHVVYDIDRLHRVLQALDSNHVQVIYDPTNIILPDECADQGAYFDRALELIGEKIVTLHAKDFIVRDGKLVRVPPGQGILDYAALLQRVGKLKPGIPLLMEETAGEARDPALAYLRSFDALC